MSATNERIVRILRQAKTFFFATVDGDLYKFSFV